MHRIVVTGIGAIGPIGHNAEETWQNLIAGKSGVGPITLFDSTDFSVHIAAEIKDFNPGDFLDRREVRRQDRFEWIANIAANEAIADSGLEVTPENSHRIGVAISSGVGGIETFIEQTIVLHEEGPRRISPFAIPRLMTNGGSGTVSIAHGLRGPSFCVTSACASSSDGLASPMSSSPGVRRPGSRRWASPPSTASAPTRPKRTTRPRRSAPTGTAS
jgi:3-oxoacyl-[acyl-carrier-protein] synthase II